ncbi:uncharacterized protein LOC110463939 [Mizuhopecten yessoensis]|uniref:uncharacterized protein LOC110463939 n=1 Tax=Mizuhopecten yessoensis TaxID=6573 RepID=UPI000B45F69F|nr:uncharacterized protein LOC110463939 [Mizuhopecten yessoensis]
MEIGSPKPPFLDEEKSYTNSTSIQLMMIKTSEVIWKHIIISKTKDKREVVRLKSRNDIVLVDKELEADTDYQIEIYVKIGDKRSESQFVFMKTKDVKVSMPCLIGAITGGAIVVGGLAAFGPILAALGFGSGGIISGTMAAWLMSFGNISAGSLFAILQSIGVVGLSITVKAAFLAAGLSIGCMAEVM